MKARENPFATDRVLTIRYSAPGADTAALVARFHELGCRAAIVGLHGRGKTTLLEDLEAPLAALGLRITRLRLDSEHRRFAPGLLSRLSARIDSRDLICLDGAEQLGRARWMLFRWRMRRAGGLLITSHRRCLLPTLIECTTSAELLERIVGRLAPADRRIQIPAAADLFARHHGNLREALRELYDAYAAAYSDSSSTLPAHPNVVAD